MEANDKREGPAEGPKEAGEPAVDLRQLAGSLLRMLRAVPWMSLGAIGTAVGVALLYAYFRSIDFMPSDIASILAASVFVALLALGFYLFVVLALIGPGWAFREFGLPVVPVPDRPASPLESASRSLATVFIWFARHPRRPATAVPPDYPWKPVRHRRPASMGALRFFPHPPGHERRIHPPAHPLARARRAGHGGLPRLEALPVAAA